MSDISRRPTNLSWMATAIGCALLVLGVLLSKAAQGSVMIAAYLAGGQVMFLGLLSLARTSFSRRQASEEEEVAEYRRTHNTTELFEDADEAVRLATRTNEHFLKYFVPFFTIILGLATLIAGLLLWRHWAMMDAFPVARRPLSMAALSVLLALTSAVCGSYFVGVSREAGCRWLRPSGAWMFLTGSLFLLSGGVMLCEHFGKWPDVVDHHAAQAAVLILVVLAVENVLSFVIEFYRPRMPGEELRPLPESRLLALLTEPGGVARNVAASLDYQFGFQVSEVWFYRFLDRAVVPFAAAMVILLWLLTCIVTLEPHENGIREFFGEVRLDAQGRATILDPGFYWKWPWPFAKIRIFPVAQVQELAIGHQGQAAKPTDAAEEDDGHGHDTPKNPAEGATEDVILWSHAHGGGEVNFVVANEARAATPDSEGSAVNVSFLATSIPIYFRVSNLYDYEYKHADALETLRALATREVVRMFAETDFEQLLGPGRAAAGALLAQRIDVAARHHDLGVDIIFAGLQALHPPVEVGAAFDGVVAASESMHEGILQAEATAMQRLTGADGERVRLLNDAEAYREERRQVSGAEAERFVKQLLAYEESPRLFVLNSYLDVLETEGAAVRKYVVGVRNAKEVYILDLVEKVGHDLLDLDLDTPEETQ